MARHLGFVAAGRLEQRIKRMAKARGLHMSQWFRVIVDAEWTRYSNEASRGEPNTARQQRSD
jgi:hypothetical protein